MKKIGLLLITISILISCVNEKSNDIDKFLNRMDFLINQYDKELSKSVLDNDELSKIVQEIEEIDIKAGEEFGYSASDKQMKRYQELIKQLDKVLEKEEKILEKQYEK